MTERVNFEKIGAIGELVNRVFALSHNSVSAEAVFVHGWGDLYEEMIELTAKMFKESGAKFLLLNSAPEYETKLPGFKYWKNQLENKFHIPAKHIFSIGSSSNTQFEALELAKFLKEQNISKIIVLSVPQHIVRAFLTDLGVLREAGISCQMYPKTLTQVDWMQQINIRNLSGSNEETTRLGRTLVEYARIIEYRSRFENGDQSFTIASIEQGLTYLKKL